MAEQSPIPPLSEETIVMPASGLDPSSDAPDGSGVTSAVLRYYRVFVLAVAAVLIYGIWTYIGIPRTEDPEFEARNCHVVTLFPGAAADKVEALISRPLEEAIEELENIKNIISTSSSGVSIIEVFFDNDSDPDEVIDLLRERLGSQQSALPTGATAPEIVSFNTSDIPVTMVSVFGTVDYSELERVAELLEDELETLELVAGVQIEGQPKRQVLVDVDNGRMSQYRMPLIRIRDVLRTENAGVPGGQLDAGQRRFLIKSPNEFSSVQDIRDTVVGSSEGSLVYVRDVATVTDGFEDAPYKVRTSGLRAILVTANKKDKTNTTAVSKSIRRLVERFREDLPEGVQIAVISDRGEGVEQLLGSLVGNALGGGVIVVIMVTLFLGVRQAVVVSVSLPLSILIAFILMKASGVDLNQVSIFGLVLALGMLVDSSLVVVENIGRHLEEGSPLHRAITSGVDQVKLPVLSSTLTTAAAFIPMLFMSGNIGAFIRDMPLALIFALSGSFVTALTVIPLLCYPLWRNAPPTPEPATESRLMEAYNALIKRALRNRAITMVLAVLVFSLSLAMIPLLGIQFFPDAEKPFFLIHIRLPTTANIAATDLIASQVESLLVDDDRVRDYTVNVGKGGPRIYYNEGRENLTSYYAQVLVNLERDLELSTEEFVVELQPKLRQIVGATVEPKILEQGPVSAAAIQLRIMGDDLETLAELATSVREAIADVEGIADLRDTLGEPLARLDLDLERTRAGRIGVDSYVFASTVFAALHGEEATQYRDNEDEVGVVVRLDPKSLTEISDLLELYIPTASGNLVALREIAEVKEQRDFARIGRRNGRRLVSVDMDTQGRLTSDVAAEIEDRLADLALPEGYVLEMGGENEERDESFGALARAMAVAVLLIYAILAIQFNSFVQPFVILLTVPFGVIGAIFGLFITGQPFGFMAFIGIVSLTGIIINDAIVLTDFTNYLMRERKLRMYEALLEAGRVRLRPVLLTSITTIVGLVPLAIFGGTFWSPLASAVIFGLMGSTVLILILLPVIYSLLVRPSEAHRTYRNWRRIRDELLRQAT